MCSPDCFLAFLAVLFPPIAVWIKVGICSADSLINIALCCLGYLPGLLHAWYIILKYPEPNDEYPDGYQPIVAHSGGYQDPDGNRVTYYYVAHQSAGNTQHPHAQRTYGTTPPFSQQQHAAAPPVPGRPTSATGQAHNSAPNPAGESSSAGPRPPPTYAEAVKGDHKIQTQD